MKIAITGKNGQLGKSIFKQAKKNDVKNNPTLKFTFIDREELDLSNLDKIEKYFLKNKFDVIVNTAAYTLVDRAEDELQIANQINNLAVRKLAEVAETNQIYLIHISTDYVFDGKNNSQYDEEDQTNPINAYGKTKLAGEMAIQEIMQNNATIIRTSWVYSEFKNNFVKKILDLGKEGKVIKIVDDQIGSPTYASDLADVILNIIKNRQSKKKEDLNIQTYHYSNDGEISWYDFAKQIFKLSKIDCEVEPINTEDFLTKAERPKNTTLSKIKIKQDLNLTDCNWSDSLKKAIDIIEINNYK